MEAPEHTEVRDDAPEATEGVESLEAVEEVEITGESAMVDALRRYRQARDELDVQKRRAKEYIEQVKAETEADLAPLEARLQRLRASMQAYIDEHNAGRKFKCAGLGTVYTSRGFRIAVSDEKALLGYVEARCPAASLDEVFPRRLSTPAAKRLAQEGLEEGGEQIPGVEAEATSTLNVRLSKTAVPQRTGSS